MEYKINLIKNNIYEVVKCDQTSEKSVFQGTISNCKAYIDFRAKNLRSRMHKGKLRTKYRVPRKLKKQNKIDLNKYFDRLKEQHGDDWYKYMVCGG